MTEYLNTKQLLKALVNGYVIEGQGLQPVRFWFDQDNLFRSYYPYRYLGIACNKPQKKQVTLPTKGKILGKMKDLIKKEVKNND